MTTAKVIADWRTVDVLVRDATSDEEAVDWALAAARLVDSPVDDVTVDSLRSVHHVEFTIRNVRHDPNVIRAFHEES